MLNRDTLSSANIPVGGSVAALPIRAVASGGSPLLPAVPAPWPATAVVEPTWYWPTFAVTAAPARFRSLTVLASAGRAPAAGAAAKVTTAFGTDGPGRTCKRLPTARTIAWAHSGLRR